MDIDVGQRMQVRSDPKILRREVAWKRLIHRKKHEETFGTWSKSTKGL